MHRRLCPKVVAVSFVIAIFMTGVVVVNAAPLVLYQGDSIVKKRWNASVSERYVLRAAID